MKSRNDNNYLAQTVKHTDFKVFKIIGFDAGLYPLT